MTNADVRDAVRMWRQAQDELATSPPASTQYEAAFERVRRAVRAYADARDRDYRARCLRLVTIG